MKLSNTFESMNPRDIREVCDNLRALVNFETRESRNRKLPANVRANYAAQAKADRQRYNAYRNIYRAVAE